MSTRRTRHIESPLTDRPDDASPHEPVPEPKRSAESGVTVEGNELVIHDLHVSGPALEATRGATARGLDAERVVREILDVGGAMLLHGAHKATVDAVGAEVDRLLTVLAQRDDTGRAVAALRAKLPAKGFDFEELVAPVIDAAHSPYQDVVEYTGVTHGIGDAKVGDFVVTLNARDTGGRERRVTYEAKDQQMTMPKALEELDAAMANRDAQVGVLIFASAEQAPLLCPPLRVFPGNRIMCVYDRESQDSIALDVAVQLARAVALAETADDLPLDRAELGDRLARLVEIIEVAKTIKRGLSTVRRGVTDADNAYAQLRQDALAVIAELKARL